MKCQKTFCIFLFAVLLCNICLGQIASMGFTQKTPSLLNQAGRLYYPKMQIVNDTLFVCTARGIYLKDMTKESKWKLYAFEDACVIEFVRNGNVLIANAFSTTNGQDSLLLLSRDGGKTYEDYTSECFQEYGKNHLFRIAQNPLNPSSILTCAVRYGVYGSTDFGKNWKNLYPYSVGMDIACVTYHPLDTTIMFYSGENRIQRGEIYKSADNGNIWICYEVSDGDNCVHKIDFHPNDPNILVFGGEGKIGISKDKGDTWQVKNLSYTGIYFYHILFDKENPNILYASGPNSRHHGNDRDTIWVYRSTDMGESWHLAYKEYLGANGGEMIDMVKYKDKLIFYTRELGVLQLDLKTTPVVSLKDVSVKRDLTVYPNPVVETMYFQTDKKVQRVDLINSTGKRVQSSLLGGNERSVDVSRLSEGIYLAVFYTGGQRKTEKICIARQQ